MDLINSLSDNPYFSAGFGLFGVGVFAAAGRKLSNAGLVLFRRHCVTTLGLCKFLVVKIIYGIENNVFRLLLYNLSF